MSDEKTSRRDFFGMALGAWAAVGGLGALYAAKRTWDPLPSVKAAGFTTIDLADAKPNELRTEMWRGKPVFVLKKTSDMPKDDRDIVVGKDRYLVCIGLCTHLGCIPAYKKEKKNFHCACHGGVFDVSGRNIGGPPPKPLVIPPFKIKGTKLVLGETGPEYEKLKASGLA